ncbi:MAG: VOC family protein [Nitrospiraceae bacterium]
MITSIAFTVYPVTDLARARRFYEETLGLTVSRNFRDEWAE